MSPSWRRCYALCRQRGLSLWLRCKDLAENERGQDMVEYALLAGFVAVAASVFFPQIAEMLVHVLDRHVGRLVKKAANA